MPATTVQDTAVGNALLADAELVARVGRGDAFVRVAAASVTGRRVEPTLP